MPSPRELMRKCLADGRVDGHEVKALGDLIYADDVVYRKKGEFLASCSAASSG